MATADELEPPPDPGRISGRGADLRGGAVATNAVPGVSPSGRHRLTSSKGRRGFLTLELQSQLGIALEPAWQKDASCHQASTVAAVR